jgi:hypothetical protein
MRGSGSSTLGGGGAARAATGAAVADLTLLVPSDGSVERLTPDSSGTGGRQPLLLLLLPAAAWSADCPLHTSARGVATCRLLPLGFGRIGLQGARIQAQDW